LRISKTRFNRFLKKIEIEMKRIRKFLIILYIFFTVLVLVIQPGMHKPVVLENTDFKIKEQLLHPQKRVVSDYEVKLKFKINHKRVAQAKDTSIHIKPEDDERKITFDVEDDTSQKEMILQTEENITSGNTVDMDLSGTNDRYKDADFNTAGPNVQYSEQQLALQEQLNAQRNMQLNSDDNSEKDLTASDEVGNRKFKGSRDEIVAWGVWRSNLQNRIMDESAVEAPIGTLILFSFNVSDKGKISNLQYSCSNRKYYSSARADMVEVLEHLQGDSILKFPENTKRKNVRFKGGFLLDYTTQYSSPSDYTDYERVKLW